MSGKKLPQEEIDKIIDENIINNQKNSTLDSTSSKPNQVVDPQKLKKAEMKLKFYEDMVDQQLDEITKNGDALKNELKEIVSHLRQSSVNLHDYLKSEM